MSDENETKVSETTASIRDHIDRERRVADAVLRSGDRIAYSQIMRAASDVEQFTLPIAEERDALAQEVDRLRAWKSAVESAAYDVVKMHDDGPECWPAWFEGYGVDGLCAAMYPEAPHG